MARKQAEIDLKKVEALAAHGLNEKEIAESLGISVRTLHNRKSDTAFVEALRRGKSKGIAVVTSALFELVKDKNLGAICFYLKCRAGWSEKSSYESEGMALRTIAEALKNIEIVKDK